MMRRRRFLTLLGILAAAQLLVFLKLVSAEPRAGGAAPSDREILHWVREDNYAPLRQALERSSVDAGYRPDLDVAEGFDDDGFAHDGSGWRAVRVAPMQGSIDDLYIRLPPKFRIPNSDYYRRNFEILETAILVPAERGVRLPATYAGQAMDEAVRRSRYPAGTEVLRMARYLDPDEPTMAGRRLMKLRYSRKLREAEGWLHVEFMEDANGHLRLQSAPIDSATADGAAVFARKVPGSEGWRPQDPRGIPGVTLPSRERALELDRNFRRNVLERRP